MPTGLTRDAGWQIGVSRTLRHPAPVVWDFVNGPEGRALWLGPGVEPGEVRGFREGERIRLIHGHTTLQITVTPAADGAACVLRLHQERLRDAEERTRQRAHWKRVMAAVAEALG